MATLTDLKTAASYIDPALTALELIQKLTNQNSPGTDLAFKLIHSVVNTFITGATTGQTPQDILDRLTVLATGLHSDDAIADAALADKFK